jgi:hypothetical protein
MSYVFQNKGSQQVILSESDLTVPLFMNSTSQKVMITGASTNYKVDTVDNDGNLGAIMNISNVVLPETKEGFNVTYIIESVDTERPTINIDNAQGFDAIPSDLIQKYVVPTETFMMDNPAIKSKAIEVAGGENTVLATVTKLIEYIMSSTTYQNFEVPQYPNATLLDRRGDCDDQSILLISMARSLGIPAYMEVGIVLNSGIHESETSWDGHLTNIQDGIGWHGWSMIYVPPWGWIPVDLTLTSAKSGLELIQKTPEYGSTVIKCFDVNLQKYVGDSVDTMRRVSNSSLYVSLTDRAEVVYSNNSSDMYLLATIGLGVTGAIVLMFLSGSRRSSLQHGSQ